MGQGLDLSTKAQMLQALWRNLSAEELAVYERRAAEELPMEDESEEESEDEGLSEPE